MGYCLSSSFFLSFETSGKPPRKRGVVCSCSICKEINSVSNVVKLVMLRCINLNIHRLYVGNYQLRVGVLLIVETALQKKSS